jgi:mRNA interferase YafQ
MSKIKKSEVLNFLQPKKDKEGEDIEYKYTLQVTKRFKKDVQKCQKSGYDLDLLRDVIVRLTTDGQLPQEYKPHPLEGNYQECMECHIKPDWLMVWKQNDDTLVIVSVTTGTHSDLFS